MDTTFTSWQSILPDMSSLGPWVAQGLGVLAILLGIILWLMGKRLARPACAGVWVILGMMIAGGVCHMTGHGGLLPLWLAVGGILGGLLGWMIYRLCLAMVLCVVLMVCVPAGVHLAHDALPRPILADDTQELVDAIQNQARQAQEQLAQDEDGLSSQDVINIVGQIASQPWQKLQDHWQSLSLQARWILLASAGIGGLAGFILGLVFSNLAAMAGSSFLGMLCMTGGSAVILAQFNPSLLDVFDRQTSICLLTMGLITLTGIGIQWTLQRRQADN